MPIRLTLALAVAHWLAALTLFQGSPGSPGPCCLTAHAKFGLIFPKATVVGLGPWRHCARESSSGAYTPPESSAKLIVSSVPHLHQKSQTSKPNFNDTVKPPIIPGGRE